MKRNALGMVLLLMVALVSTIVVADTQVHEGAGVEIWIPDNWTVETDEDLMMVNDPDEEIVIAFLVLEAKELDAAIDELESTVSELVSDLKTDDEPEKMDINGMAGVALDGTGKVEDTKVDVGILLVVTPKEKVLLVLGFAESAKFNKHKKTLKRVFQSLKPSK